MSTEKCRFKKFFEGHTCPYCRVTYGECQFIVDELDSICPIRWAWKDWEPTPPAWVFPFIYEDGVHLVLDENAGNYVELVTE